MSSSPVLDYLQATFPGRTTLYPEEMAQLLSKTEIAISKMLSRGQAPFKVRKIGKRWSTDIISVAQWLETAWIPPTNVEHSPLDIDELQEDKNTPRKAPEKRRRAGRASLAGKLMEIRHARALEMARFAQNLPDGNERAFFHEVAKCMLFSKAVLEAEFTLDATWYDLPVTSGMLGCHSRKFFLDSMAELKLCISRVKAECQGYGEVNILIKRGRKKIYESFRLSAGEWLTLQDDYDIEV